MSAGNASGGIIPGATAGARPLFWAVTLLGLALVYAPAVYLLAASLNPGRQLGLVPPSEFSLVWYQALGGERRLLAALVESLWIGLATAVVATPAGLAAALAYRALQRGRGAFFLFLMFALFVPGTIQGLGLSVVFKLVAVRPGWLAVAASHVLWALPFAFTVSLMGLAAVKPSMEKAARDLGAGPWRTFADVIFPLVRGAVVSAFVFSFLLSFNEYARAYYLVGRQNTLPLHMFGAMNAGTSPTIYAFSGLVLFGSILIVGLLGLMMGRRRGS
ncbi:ABC transporter permease [Methylobrevis albus]|uniref:ABC transporter permease n=1 Tax=Methylobrevis albus TaxID=2793297 RepID=A0A931I3U4_9HYPH|nr:ABC transporter permease [Methylobrevis albus]MBH0238760.1 ABC transporter permease [Methylobrevis albus]